MRTMRSPHHREDKWRETEYQSLVRHFEEIYKLSVASVAALVAGCGAVLAYGGVSAANLGIVCLLILLWNWEFLNPIRRYTLHVLSRLADLETAARRQGHFYGWRQGVQSDRYRTSHTGTLPWTILAVMAGIGAVALFFSAWLGYNPFPPSVEVSVVAKTGSGDVQLKSAFRQRELVAGTDNLMRYVRELGAGKSGPITTSPPAPDPSADKPATPKAVTPQEQKR